jgi:ABC-type thiamine transport system substrate-binding protein
MFVEPANDTAVLPDVFQEYRTEIASPLILDPAVIEASRAEWTDTWTEIVLR